MLTNLPLAGFSKTLDGVSNNKVDILFDFFSKVLGRSVCLSLIFEFTTLFLNKNN